MAYLIKTDGTIEAVEPRNGKDFQLDEMQAMMGGYIDIVNLYFEKKMLKELDLSECIAVINDEGLINGMEFNPTASLVTCIKLYGPVLICKSKQVK